MVLVQTETCGGHAKAPNDIEQKLCCTEHTDCNINQHNWAVHIQTAHSNMPTCSKGFVLINTSITILSFSVLLQRWQIFWTLFSLGGTLYQWQYVGTLYQWQYVNMAWKTNSLLQKRYIPHYKLYHRTGTVRITNCATEQVQSALQTVPQNMYSPHYKLCHRTGTVRITNCATEQVQSALPEIQHSGHMLGKDVVKLGHRVDVLVAPVQESLPLVSQHLQTEPHTHDHIGTVSARRCRRPKNWFRIPELELNCSLLQRFRTNSVEHPVGTRK
jgi:hypothetical protein